MFNIKSYLYNSILHKFFIAKIAGTPITLAGLNNHLNQAWDTIKPSFETKVKIGDLLSIKNRLTRIYQYLNTITKVEFFDTPLLLEYKDLSIVLNYYSFVLANSKKIILVPIDINYLGIDKNSSTIAFIYSFLYYYIGKELDEKFDLSLVKLDSFTLYEGNLIKSNEVNNILESVYNLIKYKIKIPKNDYFVCTKCEHKKECIWSLSD